MRLLIYVALGLFYGVTETNAGAAPLGTLRSSVFKIQIVSNEPNFGTPWTRATSHGASGTGFYIGGPGILTNAHVIANASFITVLRDGDTRPVPAYVRFVAHDCDLALLEVESWDAFSGLSPLHLGTVPRLQSPVTTIGFPTGGDQLSITQGIVSRISYRRYVHHGNAEHLLVQVDSAINPGNSGGPVVQGHDVVGVAFQAFTQAENTGYIIPTPVISRFLKDVEDGRYDGHPQDGLTTMDGAMENPSTAAFHGLSPSDGGVKVAHVADWAPTFGHLMAGDIILAVDGQGIGADGKVTFKGERVDFRTVFDLKQIGEHALFAVARDGRQMRVDVEVKPSVAHPEPVFIYAKHAPYFVWGGLVFATLNRSLLKTWGDRWWREAPLSLRFLDLYARYEKDFRDAKDIVVLTKRLPDDVNAYATENVFGVVTEIDEHAIKSLNDVVTHLETDKDEYVVIKFFGSDDPLVLSRDLVMLRSDIINRKYGVTPDRWLAGPEEDGAVRRESSDAKP